MRARVSTRTLNQIALPETRKKKSVWKEKKQKRNKKRFTTSQLFPHKNASGQL